MIQFDIKHKHNDISGWYEVDIKINHSINCHKLKTIKENILNHVGGIIDVAIDNKFKELISEEVQEDCPTIYEW